MRCGVRAFSWPDEQMLWDVIVFIGILIQRRGRKSSLRGAAKIKFSNARNDHSQSVVRRAFLHLIDHVPPSIKTCHDPEQLILRPCTVKAATVEVAFRVEAVR
jgi:hypothetical protein